MEMEIVGILSCILCSELNHHFREIFNATLGVRNVTEGSFLVSMQLVWCRACPTIHECEQFHL